MTPGRKEKHAKMYRKCGGGGQVDVAPFEKSSAPTLN